MRLGLGLGVKNSGFVGGYDSAASAFLAATGITSKTESDAVNNLVIRLKQYGLWSKMKAIYPFVSDTINLSSYTEDFTNAYWTVANASITANSIVAPNGTLTADKLVVNTATSTHQVRVSISNVLAQTYTMSIYAKKGELNFIRFWEDAQTGKQCYFNLNTGVATNVDMTSATIENVGNDWYRCIAVLTLPSSGVFGYRVLLTPDGTTTTFTGNGIDGVYLWGAQLEQSASATTYQPIATTPANRFVSQFKYNLKDARDLDAAFRLAFNGTWTYSKQGATPNGVNAYANTYVNPTTVGFTQTDTHISAYLRTDSNGAKVDIGGSYNLFMGVRWANNYNYPINRSNNANGTSSSSIGYFLASRVDNVRDRMFKNGTNVTNFTGAAVSLDNNTIMISATNGGGLYSDRQTAFNTIGNGLTDTEATNLYTSVQLFQQELSRYVGVPIVSDANAQAFLDAAVITDQTQANAVNTLVTDLKSYGLWTKMKAIYPFVGGTATTHKWNLKDPRDLDAAYRLAFSGAWTHSSTGALPNGANAYADSFLIPSTALTLNNTSFGYYSRTNSSQSPSATEMAVGSSGTQLMYLRTKNSSGNAEGYSYNTNPATVANANSQGLYNVSRISDSSLKLYKNGSSIASLLTTQTGTLPSNKFYLGAVNYSGTVGEYSNKESAFAYIGDGFSDTEAANLYTAVQKYQTSLSRQV